MNRHHFLFVLLTLFFTISLVGCSLPGWNENEPERIEELEPQVEEAQLDFSGIFIGLWMEWSEARDAFTGYSYVFYEDGVVLVNREDSISSILQGSYEFVGNNTFAISWELPGASIDFEVMIWEILSIKNDEVNFLINGEQPFTLKRYQEEKPPLATPPPVEPPPPPQTPSTEIMPN